MREDFLHYIWKYKQFNTTNLKGTEGEPLQIVQLGQHNSNAGPDFFNAQLRIKHQLWAGNVEIHLKSSDWYVHHHETDPNYDNVILHVVWEHDTEIFRKDNTSITTLVLKPYINAKVYENYTYLIRSKKWINCEDSFADVDDFLVSHWLERLYIERLNRKSDEINKLLKATHNNWEAVLFKLLAKNFGLKVNAQAFLSLANSFDFTIIRKLQPNCLNLEALFFGQTHLLNSDIQEAYYLDLQQRYKFLKTKFNLNNSGVSALKFFRLRPANFPTIRLAQLANLYHQNTGLFSKVIHAKTKDELYKIFTSNLGTFWDTHYTFFKTSKISKKHLSKSFTDLLIINTLIPIKFSYEKSRGKDIDDKLIDLVSSLKLELNSITTAFLRLKHLSKTALTSQALIQLKTEYCIKNKCLQCAIGNSLISKK